MGYAVAALMALVAGRLLATGKLGGQDWLLLASIWLGGVPLSVSYAARFHYTGDDLEDTMPMKREAFGFSTVIAWILIALATTWYFVLSHAWPPIGYFIALGIYAGMNHAFVFVLRKERQRRVPSNVVNADAEGDRPWIRDQLVWPIVLAIAASLYFGRFLDTMAAQPPVTVVGMRVYFPVLVLILAFLILELVPEQAVAPTSMVALFFVGMLTALNVVRDDYLRSMTFFTVVAAYVAVFEAWRVTAHLARRFQDAGGTIAPTVDHADTPEGEYTPMYQTYFMSSGFALVLAAIFMPLLFILSSNNTLFLWGLVVHATVALAIWYWVGAHPTYLTRTSLWVWAKVLIGFLFLSVLVLDARLPRPPSHADFKDLTNLGNTLVVALLVGVITGEVRQLKTDEQVWARRSRFLSVASVFSAVMLVVTALTKQFAEGNGMIVARAEQAYLAYLVFAVLSAGAFLIIQFWPTLRRFGASRAMTSLIGVLTLIRGWTGFLIFVAVVLPSVANGVSLGTAALVGVPFAFAAFTGFALNDVFDVERDGINKPDRALPSGRVSIAQAYACVVTCATLCVAGMVLGGHDDVVEMAQATALVGSVLYSGISRWWPWFKGFFTAVLCVTPIVAVIELAGLAGEYYLLVVALWFFIGGREQLMDALDVDGDATTGLRTIAVRTSPWTASVLGMAMQLMGVSVFVSLATVLGRPVGLSLIVGSSVSGLAAAWWFGSRSVRKRVVRMLWFPMIVGLAVLF